MTVEKTFGTLWVAACAIGCVGGLALGGVVGCVSGVALAVIIPSLFLIGLFSFQRQRLGRRFKRDFEGRWLLVCSRSGHWGPFIDNNVLTVLPEGVQVVWVHPRRSGREYPASAIRLLFVGVEKPYLIRYVSGQPEVRRLHEKLVGLSHTTKHDQHVASLVRSVLLEFMEGA